MTDPWFIETPVCIVAGITPKCKNESQRNEEEHSPLQVISFDVICDIIVHIIKRECSEDRSNNGEILDQEEN